MDFNTRRYNYWGDYLRKIFGEKIYKISLDAGFSCPNRDRTLGTEGCIYCLEGSRPLAVNSNLSLQEQLKEGIANLSRKYNANKFIAYFQAYSNTHADVSELKDLYTQVLKHPDIVGLSISTRPDCIDEEKLDLLASLSQQTLLWLELGLQTIHERTLGLINRRHSLAHFKNAFRWAKKRGIKTCVHLILGLPLETKKEMIETVQYVSTLPVDGIKFHHLHVLKGTRLAELYKQNEIFLFEKDKYIKLIADILEIIPREIVIHRLIGEAEEERLIAPLWSKNKSQVIQEITQELEKRGSFQGIKLVVPEKVKKSC